ncbi:PspC domain-containing protein [Brumimicrobium aurantiacum]|uniref:PspC domain-containing protein n=1 Tax=Brumimicrobium aurantiacum TaxID=1737063 RepID=A0A3E1EUR4_9FLAO|nr:PspC domain-containing protein [Brumimicrobium aurantiacum]RFC53268.1 PspC domain-containing protein [Brumimicrobium aurantiacum]
MKRTTTINLAGMVYHIEEDAFQILQKYLLDIKRVFSYQEGVDEMVYDIEVRIAELFQERLNKNKEVITSSDVNEVVQIMGSPNQYDENYEGDTDEQFYEEHYESPKRLYRDTDEGMLGGVSAGLAHFFGIDPVLIRVFWIILVLVGGSGVLIYIIAWIAIPEAKTTAQKLQMRGQSPNLDNIKDFADSVTREAKTGFKRASRSVKRTFKKKDSTLVNITKGIGRVLGFGMFIIGLLGLISVVLFFVADVAFFFVNDGFFSADISDLADSFFLHSTLAFWLIFTISVIPLLLMILAGGILLFNLKSKSRALIISLLVIWIASIIGLSIIGTKTGVEFKKSYKINDEKVFVLKNDWINKNQIQVNLIEDGLPIPSANNYNFDNYITITDEQVKLGYAKIEITSTKDSLFSYSVERQSNGPSLKKAKLNAEEIIYSLQQVGNSLNLPSQYEFPRETKFRGQRVKLKIFVPVGKEIILNGNLEDYPIRVRTINRFSDDYLERSSVWKSSIDGMEFVRFLER